VTLGAALLAACERSDGPGQAPAPDAALPLPAASMLAGAQDRTHAVDETAKAPDFEMKVQSVQECKVDEYHRPRAGNLKLGVQVWIQGTSDREVPVNPFSASLTDSAGNSYNMAFGGCQPGLQSVRLRKGDEASGFVTFEIPKQARGLKLEFRPFVLRTGNEPVRFDLAR
jgi:hypothetical protein